MIQHTDAGRLRETAQRALQLPGVEAADVTVYTPDDAPELEILVGPNYGHVPPRVLRLLADEDCAVRDVSRQGEYRIVYAVAA